MNDPDSCFLQGAEWDYVYGECRGTSFVVTCDRGDEPGVDRTEDERRAFCLDIVGCGWIEDDGTTTMPSGHCEGAKIPCETLRYEDCLTQVGCSQSTTPESCEDANGIYYLDNIDCDGKQIGPTVAYSVIRASCEATLGCAWVE